MEEVYFEPVLESYCNYQLRSLNNRRTGHFGAVREILY